MAGRMTKPRLGLLWVAAVLAAGGFRRGALAQETGRLSGRVTELTSGSAVAGALVSIVDGGGSTITDAAGQYLLPSVPIGRQTLRVTRIGYVEQTREMLVRAGETATLDSALALAPVTLGGVTGFGETRTQAEIREVRQSPFSVSVIDGQRLAGRGLTLDETLQRVSGMQVRRSGIGMPNGLSARIRVLRQGAQHQVQRHFARVPPPTMQFHDIFCPRGATLTL
jgi:hypothetical protein